MKLKQTLQSEWKGRETNPKDGIQYWYQKVRCMSSSDFFSLDSTTKNGQKAYAILGYACDEGVRRNGGRIGAKAGPKAIREQLAKLAIHKQAVELVDLGDVVCEFDKMEQTQSVFAATVASILKRGRISIGLGGGHDLAYAHLSGIRKYLMDQQEKGSIGIINFDAHFDLREIYTKPNSGTPFRQILEESHQEISVGYFAIGIQKNANTAPLFAYADSHSTIQYVCLDELNYGAFPQNSSIYKEVTEFVNKHEHIYLSIDLDGFSASYAPGVSAVSAFGLSAAAVAPLIEQIAKSGKIIAFDIAELNPTYDIDHRTAKLAAQLVDLVVNN